MIGQAFCTPVFVLVFSQPVDIFAVLDPSLFSGSVKLCPLETSAWISCPFVIVGESHLRHMTGIKGSINTYVHAVLFCLTTSWKTSYPSISCQES